MKAMAEKEYNLLKRLETQQSESHLIKVLECSTYHNQNKKERALSEVEIDGPS